MDEYPGKRAADGLVVSRKGSVLRESPNNRDNNAQFCNRIGCNGRLNSPKATQSGEAKPWKPSVRASCSGKEIIGSSSSTSASIRNPRKSISEPCKKLSPHMETDSSETGSVQDEPEISDPITPPGKVQRGLNIESKNAKSSEVSLLEVGSSIVATSARSRRNFNQRSGMSNQATSVSPSASSGSKNTSMQPHAGATRNGLRNLKCNSISDVVTSSYSSSDASFRKRRETVKKRNSEAESSSTTKGKKINGSLSGQNSSSDGISISDSRRGRNMPPNRDSSPASVRTRRSVNSQTRLSTQGSGNNLSRNGSPVVIPRRSHCEISMDISPGSSQLLSTEAPLGRTNSYGRSGSSSENIRNSLPSGPAEVGFSRSLVNRDNMRRYNMDGVAEVLLALERIEHDEELTFEQLLSLETNLFLNGLSFYDQHRDMRLDIDNMSYEELLALEERMGNVSTALPEEALSECLKISIYQSMPLEGVAIGSNDDVKCSVCQEEYVGGDEVGRLQCEHSFHAVCIQQWLGLKNWCPICKSSAAPSPSTSPNRPST
ncbi:E3 ubiquitin-protein ligase MBR2-like [Humulus lupulus]|uniref:E3 ubiquitin-protein ligase MBR2-like n=1 Tax=Humulus lupulus TaxID=3486 RepID=UPI002B402CBC|nr:E3 ubiquitin-protein ligase MBR2-like [Humulus lupulus]XP_062097862.1 E3 ubiquitin-protein ligase MBR2-like [Humulus lupulus]